jgi:hypothetical protein
MKLRNRNRYVIIPHLFLNILNAFVIKDLELDTYYCKNGQLVIFLERQLAYSKCRELNNPIPVNED